MNNTKARELKIQTVVGLIKKAPIQDRSHKYSTKGVRHSSVRSRGIYAEKVNKGIAIGYWSWYVGANPEANLVQLAKFVEFATAQGYKLTQATKSSFIIEVA
jgi:hypothetical protein